MTGSRERKHFIEHKRGGEPVVLWDASGPNEWPSAEQNGTVYDSGDNTNDDVA